MGHASQTPSAYCRQCCYALTGLPDKHRCPECGREFDLADGRTFRRRPRSGLWRKLRWIVYPLVLAVLVLGGAVGWTWWEWKREQSVIAWAKRRGEVYTRLVGPQWVQKRAGQWRWILERTEKVWPEVKAGENAEEIGLSRLSRMKSVWLQGEGVTDRWVKELQGMRELEEVVLNGSGVTDESVILLGTLKQLRTVSLIGTRVSGSGLTPLLGLPQLKELWLAGTPVDDSALPVLKSLRKPWTLDLSGTRITPEGVAELKMALPKCQIIRP